MNLNLIYLLSKFLLLLFLVTFLSTEVLANTQDQRHVQEEALYQLAKDAKEFIRSEVTNHNNNSCRVIIMNLDFPDHLTLSLDNYDTISQSEVDTLKLEFAEFKSTWNDCLEKSFLSLSEDQQAFSNFIRNMRATLHDDVEGDILNRLLSKLEAMVLFNNTRCMTELNPEFLHIQGTFQMFPYSIDSHITEVLILQTQSKMILLENKWTQCINR